MKKKYVFVVVAVLILFGFVWFKKREVSSPSVGIIRELQTSEEVSVDEVLEMVKELYQENNDMVGYLIIPDTKVNYPVMYTKGEDYYLRRNFQKLPSVAGTLFVDKYNGIVPRDTNLIIYGHNMDDGTMFADLLKYKDEEFYLGHKKMIYYTLEEKEEYEIVAVFLSKVYRKSDKVFKYYKFYRANTQEELDSYIDNISKLNMYDNVIQAKLGDEFITLSTCEYSQENGRLAVVAKKVK